MSERVLDIWVTLDIVRGLWCASNFITINLNSFWSTGSFSASYLKLSMILGVWRVSGRCLGVFWVTLDNGVQAIDEHSIGLIFMSWFFFTRLPRISQNVPYFGVSGRWWGLPEEPWTQKNGMLCMQLITIQMGSFLWAGFFFTQLPQIIQNVPYFGVFPGCLESVWTVSGCIWRTLDMIRGVRIQNQLIKVQFRSF